jgi:2-keto-4-pentenoate hydratase/2-oxohepta-3-ene-1,7-dioic acid hydratase in catechol pathway
VTFQKGTYIGVGIEIAGGVIPTRYQEMIRLIADGAEGRAHLDETAALGAASAIVPDRLHAPVRRPQKIFGSGPNFLKHLEEEPGAVMTDEQFFFSKLPSSVIGPGDAIELTRDGTALLADYEVELGVVIGAPARFVSVDAAPDHIYGYTVVHDVSCRLIQFKDNQITLGKGLDSFCPMGPALVARDALDVGDIRMSTYLNGQKMQDESTKAMRFSPAEMVSYLSEMVTLVPGDIISMGTPDGIGAFKDPPVYLQPGDSVTVEIEGIGALTNPVVRSPHTLSATYFFRGKSGG